MPVNTIDRGAEIYILQAQRQTIENIITAATNHLRNLDYQLRALGGTGASPVAGLVKALPDVPAAKKRVMTEDARRRIANAQKHRWEMLRKQQARQKKDEEKAKAAAKPAVHQRLASLRQKAKAATASAAPKSSHEATSVTEADLSSLTAPSE